MENKYSLEEFAELISSIELAKDSLMPDQIPIFIENIRNISEFLLFGEKFNQSAYFETFKETGLLDTLSTVSRHFDI